MMNMPIKSLSRQELRQFGLLSAGIVVGLFGLLIPALFSLSARAWPWVVAVLLVAPALIAPSLLKPVYAIWMRIGLVLGFINTRIIIFVLYFGIFVPIGLVMRLASRGGITKLSAAADSYRVVSKQRDSKHFERPY